MTLTVVHHTEVILEVSVPGTNLRTAGEPRQWHNTREAAQDAIDLGVVVLDRSARNASDVWDQCAVVDRDDDAIRKDTNQ